LVGVHLSGVKVYSEEEFRAAQQKPVVAFLVNLSYKRRVFEVLLDVVLIILSYYLATALIFGPISEHDHWQQFLAAIPILLVVKLTCLLLAGSYRGLWRYISIDSLWTMAKGVSFGSIACVPILVFAFRFAGLSRAVFVLDGLILFVLLAGSRLSFR